MIHLLEYVLQVKQDVNVSVFNVIIIIIEWKILKYIQQNIYTPCNIDVNLMIECEFKSTCQHEFKKPIKHCLCEKDYPWSPSTWPCECDKYCKINEHFKNWFYEESIIGDFVITYDEIVSIPETVNIS